MKTIKIIDLLTDLFSYRETNHEWLPKRIRFNGETFIFKDNVYCNEDNGENIMLYVNHTLDLRVQAEILDEEDEFEDIELDTSYYHDEPALIDDLAHTVSLLIKNQKKIIERLNEKVS